MKYITDMSPLKGQRMVSDEKLRKHAIALRLSDEELGALQKIADRRKMPVSFLIREGVSLVVKRYSK